MEAGRRTMDEGRGKRARGRKSEVRSQKSEVRDQRADVGSRMTGDRGRKSVGCLRTYLPVYPIFLPALLLIPNIIYPAWHESI